MSVNLSEVDELIVRSRATTRQSSSFSSKWMATCKRHRDNNLEAVPWPYLKMFANYEVYTLIV